MSNIDERFRLGGVPLDWIIQNKEWIFSGAGIFLLGAIGQAFFKRRYKTKQVQKSGKHSVNIQVGKDLNVGKEYKNDKQ